jgi:hypothetical protein
MALLGSIRKHGNSLRTQVTPNELITPKRGNKRTWICAKMMGEGNKESLVTERKYAKL